MLISEIKNKEVRELAEYYARTIPATFIGCFGDKNILGEAFAWHDTPEGYDFWCAIDEGEDQVLPMRMLMPPLKPCWTYTREYRKPISGVDYIYIGGRVELSRGQNLEYPIVKRVDL